ncbi:MAG TPA: isochorismate synthase [Rhodocyclaceae bacterium]|nr:isochorismate synthase [Rhodocyclaceae bacterium]
MIRRLRQALQDGDLSRRLAILAAGATPSTLVSATLDLGPGSDDWLRLLPSRGEPFWYWARPGTGEYRLGLGQTVHVATGGANRFAALDNTFAGMTRNWRREAAPIAFLGFAFHEGTRTKLPNALLAVPALLLECRGGRCTATVTALAGSPERAAHGCTALLVEQPLPASPATLDRITQPLADRAWLARVQAALRSIGEGRLDKVVLARSVRLAAERPVAAAPVLAALLERQPDSTIYAYGNRQAVFLGATPERLVALRNGHAEADALAGTAWPGSAQLHGDKNSREQSLVADVVRATLAPLCRSLVESGPPATLRVGQISHLRSSIGGPVQEGVSLFDLAQALHPTPAVGGAPTAGALDWLRSRCEQRGGWYSGGIGHISADGDGEIAVALRCALITGNQVELQAGAGIVAGSDPEQEFAETEAKLATLLDVLQEPAWQEKTGT